MKTIPLLLALFALTAGAARAQSISTAAQAKWDARWTAQAQRTGNANHECANVSSAAQTNCTQMAARARVLIPLPSNPTGVQLQVRLNDLITAQAPAAQVDDARKALVDRQAQRAAQFQAQQQAIQAQHAAMTANQANNQAALAAAARIPWITIHSGVKFQILQSGAALEAIVIENLPESDIIGAPQSVKMDIYGDRQAMSYHVMNSSEWSGKLGAGYGTPSGYENFARRVEPGSVMAAVFKVGCK